MPPTASLTGDLHGHAGGDTQIIAMGINEARSATSRRRPPTTSTSCASTNTGDAPLAPTIQIDLHGMTWRDFR